MGSTPVAGVEIRKLTLAPLLAPSRRSAIEVGITPQLHIGSGTPNRADHSTDLKFGLEIFGTYKWFGTHTWRIPDSKKPSNKNGAISEKSVTNCQKNFSTISAKLGILHSLLVQNVCKARIENQADMFVVQGVENGAPYPTGFHKTSRSQDPELVAYRRLPQLQFFRYLVYRNLPRKENLDNADSGSIPKKLEELGQFKKGVQ